MAGFEKLWVWQRAHKLMLEMHEIIKGLPSSERFKIANQIERASASPLKFSLNKSKNLCKMELCIPN